MLRSIQVKFQCKYGKILLSIISKINKNTVTDLLFYGRHKINQWPGPAWTIWIPSPFLGFDRSQPRCITLILKYGRRERSSMPSMSAIKMFIYWLGWATWRKIFMSKVKGCLVRDNTLKGQLIYQNAPRIVFVFTCCVWSLSRENVSCFVCCCYFVWI